MFRRKLWISIVYLLVISGVTSAFGLESNEALTSNKSAGFSDSLTADDNPREKLSDLITYLQEQGFDIGTLLEDNRFEIYEDIADRFTKSAERKSHSLDSYKSVLGFDHKSSQIIEFIDSHSDQLQKAEQEYGVSRYVIAAILGIESDFGKNIGSYNPFNAYVSMYAKDYRRDFAKAQIKELLEFVERKDIDVFELKSSYAGAMAFAQFIPYSLNKWFVGKDIFDMNNNIMSIGNYLAYFKERTGNIETAVLRYNPSDLYTQAVLDLANTAEARFAKAD